MQTWQRWKAKEPKTYSTSNRRRFWHDWLNSLTNWSQRRRPFSSITVDTTSRWGHYFRYWTFGMVRFRRTPVIWPSSWSKIRRNETRIDRGFTTEWCTMAMMWRKKWRQRFANKASYRGITKPFSSCAMWTGWKTMRKGSWHSKGTVRKRQAMSGWNFVSDSFECCGNFCSKLLAGVSKLEMTYSIVCWFVIYGSVLWNVMDFLLLALGILLWETGMYVTTFGIRNSEMGNRKCSKMVYRSWTVQ